MDDFSAKLDLPIAFEAVESIDANHMQMARYRSRDEQGYRAILRVLRSCHRQEIDGRLSLPASTADVSCK